MTHSDQPVRQILAAYQAAVLAKDVEAFVALYAADVEIFELWRQWTHDIASWRAMAKEWFAFLGDERCIVEAADVRARVSGDLALLTATLTYRAIDASGKELRSLDNRLSWVLSEIDGRWLVVHEHTSVPLAQETGKGILKRP